MDYYLINEDLEKQVNVYFINIIEKRSVKDFIDFLMHKKEEIDTLYNNITTNKTD